MNALYILIIILVIILFFLFTAPQKENKSAKTQIEFNLPDPDANNPIHFLKYLTEQNSFIDSIAIELAKMNKPKNSVLKLALDERRYKYSLNFGRYLEQLPFSDLKEYYDDEIDGFEYKKTFPIAGITFNNRLDYIINKCFVGDEVELVPEPDNVYDSNAIAIKHKGKTIGYVPKLETYEIEEYIFNGYIAQISDIIKSDYKDVIITIYENTNPHMWNGRSYKEIKELNTIPIDKKFLTPKKNAENINIFYRKKVVLLGTFMYFANINELAELLYISGADIDKSITEKVDYAIVGKFSDTKRLQKLEDFGIEVFNESEVLKILGIQESL